MRTDPESDIDKTIASDGDGDTLASGTEVGSLRLRRLLWRNPLVAVYVGFDPSQQRRMLVSEYFPTAWAVRGREAAVDLRSIEHADDFAQGLNDFAELARLRAQVEHPSLVRVRRIWEENGTCYVAQPFPNARSLRVDHEQTRDWSDETRLIRRLLVPVLGALQKLHASSIAHGSVSPDNVLMPADRTWLLDQGPVPEHADESWFGAQAERHAARAAADLRALAEVACFALTGTERTDAARALPPSQTLYGAKKPGSGPRHSDQLLRVLDTLYAATAGATNALCAELLEAMSNAEQMLASPPMAPPAHAPQSLAEALQEPPIAALVAPAPAAAEPEPSVKSVVAEAATESIKVASATPAAPALAASVAAPEEQTPAAPTAKPAAARPSTLKPPPSAAKPAAAPAKPSAAAARAAFAADLAQVTAGLSQHAQAVANASIAKPTAPASTMKRPPAPVQEPEAARLTPTPMAAPAPLLEPPAATPVPQMAPAAAIEPVADPVVLPMATALRVTAVDDATDAANEPKDETDDPVVSTGLEAALADEISALVATQPSSVDVPTPFVAAVNPTLSARDVEPAPQPIFDVTPHFGSEPVPTHAEQDVELTNPSATTMLDELLPQAVTRESALERWPELAALPVLPQPKEGPYKPVRQRKNLMLAGIAVGSIALIGLWLASGPSRKPPPSSLEVAAAMAAAKPPVLQTDTTISEPAAGPAATAPTQGPPAETAKAPVEPTPAPAPKAQQPAAVIPPAAAPATVATPKALVTPAPAAPAAPTAPATTAKPTNAVAATTPAPVPDSGKATKTAEVAVPETSPAPQKVAALGSSSNPYPSPRGECGARTNFSLYTCMQKQCKSPQFSAHIQCVMLRAKDEVIE